MAVNEIGTQTQRKESSWDKIAKVMGFASAAIGLGNGVANAIPDAEAPPAPVVDDPMAGNSLYRRFMAGQRVA